MHGLRRHCFSFRRQRQADVVENKPHPATERNSLCPLAHRQSLGTDSIKKTNHKTKSKVNSYIFKLCMVIVFCSLLVGSQTLRSRNFILYKGTLLIGVAWFGSESRRCSRIFTHSVVIEFVFIELLVVSSIRILLCIIKIQVLARIRRIRSYSSPSETHKFVMASLQTPMRICTHRVQVNINFVKFGRKRYRLPVHRVRIIDYIAPLV